MVEFGDENNNEIIVVKIIILFHDSTIRKQMSDLNRERNSHARWENLTILIEVTFLLLDRVKEKLLIFLFP